MLETGSKAIDFTLPDEHGNPVALHDFRGKKVVLYFYPKDNTPGCTKQACAFKAAYEEFKREDIVVIGISKDSSASHMKSKKKYELPLPSVIGYRTERYSGLRCLEGEKTVREDLYGSNAFHVCHR